MKSFKSYFVILGIFFVAFACTGSKELTREKATELIKASIKEETVVYDTLKDGEFQDYGFNNVFEPGKKYYSLQSQDYVQIKKIGYAEYHIFLMPKIKPYILKIGERQKAVQASLGKTADHYYSEVEVLLYKKKFNSITGLSKGDPLNSPECEVIAEFTSRIELSPIASLMLSNTPNQVSSGRACFKLYDDGWRLTKIDW